MSRFRAENYISSLRDVIRRIAYLIKEHAWQCSIKCTYEEQLAHAKEPRTTEDINTYFRAFFGFFVCALGNTTELARNLENCSSSRLAVATSSRRRAF